MSEIEFTRFQAAVRAAVGAYLRQALCRSGPPARLAEAMRYAALDGGKLLRPTLVLAAAVESGAGFDNAVPLAAAAELIQAYSLVHDDLPCMDDSALRRGRPSCHRRYGEALALLAGDALLTLAFEVGLEARPPARALRAVRELARAAGAAGMCGGQAYDLGCEGGLLSAEDARRCYALKTGALFGGCAAAGGRLGARAPIDALREFGVTLGIAYQLIDDLAGDDGGPMLNWQSPLECQHEACALLTRAAAGLPASYRLLPALAHYVTTLMPDAASLPPGR